MVALAWRETAPVDAVAPIERTRRAEAAARDTAPLMVGSTLPADVIALEAIRDDAPATGFVVAVLLSLPLWGIVIGAGVYLVAAH